MTNSRTSDRSPISMDESWYAYSGCTLILLLPSPIPPHVHGTVYLRLPRLESLSITDISSELHLDIIRDVVQ